MGQISAGKLHFENQFIYKTDDIKIHLITIKHLSEIKSPQTLTVFYGRINGLKKAYGGVARKVLRASFYNYGLHSNFLRWACLLKSKFFGKSLELTKNHPLKLITPKITY